MFSLSSTAYWLGSSTTYLAEASWTGLQCECVLINICNIQRLVHETSSTPRFVMRSQTSSWSCSSWSSAPYVMWLVFLCDIVYCTMTCCYLLKELLQTTRQTKNNINKTNCCIGCFDIIQRENSLQKLTVLLCSHNHQGKPTHAESHRWMGRDFASLSFTTWSHNSWWSYAMFGFLGEYKGE